MDKYNKHLIELQNELFKLYYLAEPIVFLYDNGKTKIIWKDSENNLKVKYIENEIEKILNKKWYTT